MLHIITPVYRTNFLQRIYETIPKKEDVVWHIPCIKKRQNEINITGITEYPIIKKYFLDCEEEEAFKNSSKRNLCLDSIKDGYFCFIDDDTIFLDEMYNLYKDLSHKKYIGMAVGEQIKKNGSKRLNASIPTYANIDTGNAIAHHICLLKCRWKFDDKNIKLPKDYVFWNSVYEFFHKQCLLINKVVSIYNKLR
jgi:hypothetical protein